MCSCMVFVTVTENGTFISVPYSFRVFRECSSKLKIGITFFLGERHFIVSSPHLELPL